MSTRGRGRRGAAGRLSAGMLAAAVGPIMVAALMLPTALVAQECGLGTGIGLSGAVGHFSYDLADRVSGAAYGLDGAVAVGGAALQGSYRRAALPGAAADLGRVVVTVPLPAALLPPGPVSVCVSGHGGAARLPVDADALVVVAGGVGLRLAGVAQLGVARTVPYAEVRGLAGRTTGSLFGVEVGGTGLAVGVEGGVRVTIGLVTMNAAVSVDGFDDGLGVTPYPSLAGELGLGLRF